MHKKVFLVTDRASKGNPSPSAIGFGIYDKEWNPLEKHAEYMVRLQIMRRSTRR